MRYYKGKNINNSSNDLLNNDNEHPEVLGNNENIHIENGGKMGNNAKNNKSEEGLIQFYKRGLNDLKASNNNIKIEIIILVLTYQN